MRDYAQYGTSTSDVVVALVLLEQQLVVELLGVQGVQQSHQMRIGLVLAHPKLECMSTWRRLLWAASSCSCRNRRWGWIRTDRINSPAPTTRSSVICLCAFEFSGSESKLWDPQSIGNKNNVTVLICWGSKMDKYRLIWMNPKQEFPMSLVMMVNSLLLMSKD